MNEKYDEQKAFMKFYGNFSCMENWKTYILLP